MTLFAVYLRKTSSGVLMGIRHRVSAPGRVLFLDVFSARSANCTLSRCSETLSMFTSTFRNNLPPLLPNMLFMLRSPPLGTYCCTCGQRIESKRSQRRQNVWNKLPSFFDLGAGPRYQFYTIDVVEGLLLSRTGKRM